MTDAAASVAPRRRPAWRRLLVAQPILRLRAIGRIAMATVARFNAHDGSAMAGYIAYAGFLSVFPFAIFFTALIGAVAGRRDTDAIMETLFDLAPPHVAQTLEPVILGVIAGGRQDVLTVAGLGALWVASNALEAIRVALDRAYGAETPRGFFLRRLLAMGFVVFAVITLALLAALIVLAPLAVRLASQYAQFDGALALDVVRYLLGGLVLVVFLYQLNLMLPSQRPPLRRLAPGVGLSAAMLLAAATGLSVYLAYAPDYTVTYGAFAGVIVTLLFFYLAGLSMILGAELNAHLLRLRPPSAGDHGEVAAAAAPEE